MPAKTATATEAKLQKKIAPEEPEKDIADSYNKPKTFEGHQYTGMQVGRSHKWYYDKGVWREKKITPDRWEINYSVTKRRAGHAPEGSGVPVGTRYHWFIMSHQFVEKLDANDYSTNMVGLKFKIAHERADKGKWSASDKTQRKTLIKVLQDFIAELEQEPEKTEIIPLEFEYKDKAYKGEAIPVMSSCSEGVCAELDITLNKEHMGMIRWTKKGWRMNDVKGQGLVNAIGNIILNWYETR